MNQKDVKHFESLYPLSSREKELSRLVTFIQEGNSAQIVSLPGVGRSNILGLLAYNREVREKHFPTKNAFVHFVMVNFSELHSRPLVDVNKLLFLNLVDSLREREMHEEYGVTNEIFRECLQTQDEFVIFQGLKRAVEYLAVEKKLTLIFLFDRFEEYVPMLSHAFFSNLRILRNLAKYRFSVVFTLYKPLEDILESELLADFYEFVAGHIVYLPLYDQPSMDFRLSYLEQLTGKKLEEETKKAILQLTGGHWKLTKLSAEAVLATNTVILPQPASGGNEAKSSNSEEILHGVQVIRDSEESSDSRRDDKLKSSVILNDSEESPTIDASVSPQTIQDSNVILRVEQSGVEKHESTGSPFQSNNKLAEFLLSQKTVQGALREILSAFTPEEMKILHVILPQAVRGSRRDDISTNPVILNDSEESLSGEILNQVQDDSKDTDVILRALREPQGKQVEKHESISSPFQSNNKSEYNDGGVQAYFKNVELIKDGEIGIPLLAAYLKSQKASTVEAKQQIVFDEEKQVIRKGEIILSDGLTAAEFRLLNHLLHNPDRVIDRNEVIDVVWQAAKSTAGVTDQAVDQLIFRIRRKIETDPNTPQHLRTIKGRGFEFRG